MSKVVNVMLVAVGSFLAGILLAPKSGKETRQDIIDKAKDYRGKASEGLDQVKQGASAIKDEVAEGVQSIKNIATDATDDAKRTVDQVKNEASARGSAVKNEAKKTVNDTKKATR